METIKRYGPEYRVLVELSGQARPLSVRELYDAISSLTPEQIHSALLTLRYGSTPYIDADAQFLRPGSSELTWFYTITWEGQELLRRSDTEATMRMRAVRRKKRWWQR